MTSWSFVKTLNKPKIKSSIYMIPVKKATNAQVHVAGKVPFFWIN